jgi:hypothetical protein
MTAAGFPIQWLGVARFGLLFLLIVFVIVLFWQLRRDAGG